MTCRRSLPFRSCLNKATSDEFIWRYVHNTNQGVMNFYGSGKKFLPHHPWLCSKDRACLRCMAAAIAKAGTSSVFVWKGKTLPDYWLVHRAIDVRS